MCLYFLIISKYNITFPGSQTGFVSPTGSPYHFLYILIYLIDREAWLERGGGVTYHFILHTPSPYRLSHILISLYHYILISVFYDPLDLLLVTLVTLSPLVFPTGFTYPIYLLVLPTCSPLSIYTCFPYLIFLLLRNFITPIPPNSVSRINAIT